ncbi:hypothetical protein Avbf_02117 [Armadillidium vulgare]|nr:hypothetical protein Avbf_02117 [Armadillidium vulgare]
MSLVIFVFGLRFIFYSLVVNPWLFLPIELLSGFTFGIFYTVMTSYASIMAPPGGEATVQGVVGAAFEGLGSPEAEGYAPPGENINHVDGSLDDHYVNLDL